MALDTTTFLIIFAAIVVVLGSVIGLKFYSEHKKQA